ncbi:MAG: winged helix-turn-helix transcriptional regulator [Deltaproteobacteria bacterium]|nr:winged helix-turn-helix transcriptional regulator [Deltaproteobacteria bacterium]
MSSPKEPQQEWRIALEAQVAELLQRVDALESKLEETPALASISPVDLGILDALRARQGGPYEGKEVKGAVVYGGAVTFGEREYLWEMERPAPGLADVSMASISAVLSVLASPQRLSLIKTLLTGPKTSAELQQALSLSSPGQLYHHLKELLSIGIVEQKKRSAYEVAARHVVPFLAVLAATVDLGATSKQRVGG